MPLYVPKKPRKYRAVNWEVLDKEVKISETIWGEISERKQKMKIDLPEKELETYFAQTRKPGNITEKNEEEKDKKDSTLLDGKKQDNLAKLLAKFRLGNNPRSPSDIAKAIFEMDLEVLDAGTIGSLSSYCPNDIEISNIKKFIVEQNKVLENERLKLGAVDSFGLLMWESVPDIPIRLSSWCYMLEFDEIQQHNHHLAECVINAVEELDLNENWKDLLSIFLQLGNIMNVDQPNGGASGFDLKSLSKYEDTRSGVKKELSLLSWVSNIIYFNYPKMINIFDEFTNVKNSTGILWKDAKEDLEKMKEGFVLVTNSHKSTSGEGAFKEKARIFIENKKDLHDMTVSAFKTAQTNFERVVKLYAMDPKATPLSDFFSTIWNFLLKLKKEFDTISLKEKLKQEKLLKEEKEKQKKQEKERKEKIKESIPKTSDDLDQIGFSQGALSDLMGKTTKSGYKNARDKSMNSQEIRLNKKETDRKSVV